MKETEKFSTKHEEIITLMECLSSNVYGMIVTNGVFSGKFYFNEAGELYNITPMLKMDGQFIDGEQASISCFDIIQSDASSLDLSCDNVTNIAHEENDDATLIRNVFTADLKDDNTICRCISNKSNSESMLNIHIFPYKGYNVSHRKEVCESNSEIKLTCQDNNLPDVFHFGKWKKTFIQIPFCTYEDVGNYTCSITDTRKNTTVFYSTTFLSVPGPPVIINSSIVKHNSKAECLLSVEFYSFDEISTITWTFQLKPKIATLQLKPVCDVDTSMYRLTVKTAHFSTSHTFEQEDTTVHTVLIMSLLIATGIVMTGLIIIICRVTKGQADEETTGHNRYTMSENEYEQIPFDRE
ncbi:TTN [Mytilus edulis]|uniref:TTN n=1 Tax=Mytilus edulis TaxID=6550 RepID=A0A8S3TB60_MYTED|nr:TTN [Mytilus edulis]